MTTPERDEREQQVGDGADEVRERPGPNDPGVQYDDGTSGSDDEQDTDTGK